MALCWVLKMNDLRMMIKCFDFVLRIGGGGYLKLNTGMSKVFGENGTLCNVTILETHLEQVQLFEYHRCVVNETTTDDADIENKTMQGKKVVSAIGAILNTK